MALKVKDGKLLPRTRLPNHKFVSALLIADLGFSKRLTCFLKFFILLHKVKVRFHLYTNVRVIPKKKIVCVGVTSHLDNILSRIRSFE